MHHSARFILRLRSYCNSIVHAFFSYALRDDTYNLYYFIVGLFVSIVKIRDIFCKFLKFCVIHHGCHLLDRLSYKAGIARIIGNNSHPIKPVAYYAFLLSTVSLMINS